LTLLASHCRTIADHHRRMAAKAASQTEARMHLEAAERWDREAHEAWQSERELGRHPPE